mmetsp:Transcript_33332/g.99268  ORF Transcript_33332/g.99268 Transcript_33332/m.99268 type:complete len:202 (-) Transcript_33332:154-759(-)
MPSVTGLQVDDGRAAERQHGRRGIQHSHNAHVCGLIAGGVPAGVADRVSACSGSVHSIRWRPVRLALEVGTRQDRDAPVGALPCDVAATASWVDPRGALSDVHMGAACEGQLRRSGVRDDHVAQIPDGVPCAVRAGVDQVGHPLCRGASQRRQCHGNDTVLEVEAHGARVVPRRAELELDGCAAVDRQDGLRPPRERDWQR